MSCQDCSSGGGSTITNLNSLYSSNCSDQNPCSTDSKNITYNGANLTCSGIVTGDSIEDSIIKLNQAVCTATGNLSGINFYCLDDSGAITTQQQFIETISEFVCTLNSAFNTFVGTTFVQYQTDVDARFDAIEVPAITCASASVVITDSLQTVLSKYCAKFVAIDAAIDISSVNWSQCSVVSPSPTTIAEGFDVIIDQICNINSGGGVILPTFNNTGSCLPAPVTSSDSLELTINKIKTRLCQSPVFDINALTWNCISKPSSTTTDLQSAVQAILSKIDAISQNLPIFDSGQFTVANVDNGNLCLGKSVTLAAGTATDKYVAINGTDSTPGYLANKITAGANIVLDVTTVPGTMIISSTGGAIADEKVKAFSGDSTSTNYLDQKLGAGASSNGVSLSLTNDLIAGKVLINPVVNMSQLILSIIETLENSNELYNLWCALNAGCPSPCQPPSNILVVYDGGNTTTTTTSSTSTSTSTSTTSTTSSTTTTTTTL
jgi:hypothetical protein